MPAVHGDVLMEDASVLRSEAPTFDDFFVRHNERLTRACLLLTGDATAAEDLAQESMAKILERWDRVSTMESPDGYLYRTALNLHRNALKRVATGARLRFLAPAEHETDVTERVLDIRRAVRSLPVAQRQALVLVDLLGYTSEEAAPILGISAASVRGRTHRARTTLRQRFGGTDE